jgi:putative SOS response-associated peptidase YedK
MVMNVGPEYASTSSRTHLRPAGQSHARRRARQPDTLLLGDVLATDEWMRSTTVFTTSDNPDIHEIHNRMPEILDKSSWDRWMHPRLADLDELQNAFKPAKKGDAGALPGRQGCGEGHQQRRISTGVEQRIAHPSHL